MGLLSAIEGYPRKKVDQALNAPAKKWLKVGAGLTAVMMFAQAYSAANGDPKTTGENFGASAAGLVVDGTREAAPVVGAGAVAAGSAAVGLGEGVLSGADVSVSGPSLGFSESVGSGSSYEVRSGDSWWGVLTEVYGMSSSQASACIDSRNLASVMLYAGQSINNPC